MPSPNSDVITSARRPLGDHLRVWRQRRRMSQLDLALDAEISQRHLSFVESGRAVPSRALVLSLADRLSVPLRDRNLLLVAAGYAPVFPQQALDSTALAPARGAIELILRGHEPYPALAIDRHWTMVTANNAVARLLGSVELDPDLLQPPVNVLRLSLHPRGLAPHIVNLPEWRAHLLDRIRHQITLTADPVLIALRQELESYTTPTRSKPSDAGSQGGIVVPLRLATQDGVLNMISTTTVFGTPLDITLSELALEAFYPADDATAGAFSRARETA